MSAVEPVSTSITFLIDNKVLSGASGEAFARIKPEAKRDFLPVRRIAYRLRCSHSYFDMLHDRFSKKKLVRFEVHRQFQVEISVTAVLAEVAGESDGSVVCLVEFDLP